MPVAKRPPRPPNGFTPHLERVEVVIEPEELPEHAGRQKVLIGEDVSERLNVVPPLTDVRRSASYSLIIPIICTSVKRLFRKNVLHIIEQTLHQNAGAMRAAGQPG